METLRIVQVAHAFPPYVGGLSHVVEKLSENLAKLGHEVEVVTLDPSGTLKEFEDLEGVRVRRFGCLAPSNCYFFPSPRVIPYLRSVEADVVHAHNVGALLVPACWFAVGSRLKGTAFVLSPHHHAAGSAWHTRTLWKPYRPLIRRVVRSAHVVHCVSEFEGRLVKGEFGVESVVIPNGVADDVFKYRWSPPDDGLVLAYAGRLEKYKRVDLLVEAASILLREGYDVVLRVIGEGPELPNILRLSDRLGLRVEHYNFLHRPEYLKLLSSSSCLVNPSMYEAFSIVVAEALGMGLPVVASLPWGESFWRFQGVLLVDGGSPGNIARAVERVVGMDGGHERAVRVQSWYEIANRLVREAYARSLRSLEGGEPADCEAKAS